MCIADPAVQICQRVRQRADLVDQSLPTASSALPTSDYVRFIKKRGSKVYITASNRNGHVTISSDGVNLTVKTQKK